MGRQCNQCGKTIDGEDMLFCPYCGARATEPLAKKTAECEIPDKARSWLEKATREQVVPKRRELLLKARKECPDCFPIEWELLFTGEKKKKGQVPGSFDYSVIKCYLLKMFQKPELFSAERKKQDRQELFAGEQLKYCLKISGNPEEKMEEYLYRLCREYIEIFLEEDRSLTGGLLGFKIEKNHEKLISGQAARMIRNMRQDSELTENQRRMLVEIFRKAYSDRFGGKTEYLDAKEQGMEKGADV